MDSENTVKCVLYLQQLMFTMPPIFSNGMNSIAIFFDFFDCFQDFVHTLATAPITKQLQQVK